jgi:long-subunit fatty acid transport protein
MTACARVRVVFILLLLATAPNLFAITDEEIYRNFEFSFQNPGARSTAMGGAFIGVADDATAAEANPAGLTILTKPEVSFEYRNVRFDDDSLNSFNPFIRGELEVVSSNDIKDSNQPSFLSVVFPAGGATVGFSRQEVLSQEGEINEDLRLLFANATLNLQATARSDFKIVNYNFSSASKLTDHFSLGVSLRYSHIDATTFVSNVGLINGVPAPNVHFETAMDDTDSAFAFNVGALYSGSHVSVGAVYKRNPKFELDAVETGPAAAKPGPFSNVIRVPDSFGFGGAVKPNDNLTISSDVVWIQYSKLTDDFQAGYSFLTDALNNQTLTYQVDDAWEYHIGGEGVVFIKGHAVALRQGYYLRPSNSLTVESAPTLDPISRQFLDRLYTKKDDEHHFTFGAGIVFGPHFQLDWAADIANTTDSFVASTVVRF